MLKCFFALYLMLIAYVGYCQDLDSLAEEVEYEISQVGVYQGKSLYIHNPFVRSDSGFCINEVLINEISWDLNLNSPALEIAFNKDLIYKPVALRIFHKGNCVPKILNPDAIVIHSSFKFVDLALNDSLLTWETKGDRKEGIYIVEKLAVDRWLQDTLIQAKGVFSGTNYSHFPKLKSGRNKYRIKYSLPSGRFLYSNELENTYYPEPIEITPYSVTDKLTLSRAVNWEITITSGRSILRGSKKVIPLRKLPPGDYFIRLGDEQIESFIKK